MEHQNETQNNGTHNPTDANVFSRTVKGKSSTYYVDVRKAKNNSLYLQIAQTTTDQEGNKKRYTIRIFAETVGEFAEALAEAAAEAVEGRQI